MDGRRPVPHWVTATCFPTRSIQRGIPPSSPEHYLQCATWRDFRDMDDTNLRGQRRRPHHPKIKAGSTSWTPSPRPAHPHRIGGRRRDARRGGKGQRERPTSIGTPGPAAPAISSWWPSRSKHRHRRQHGRATSTTTGSPCAGVQRRQSRVPMPLAPDLGLGLLRAGAGAALKEEEKGTKVEEVGGKSHMSTCRAYGFQEHVTARASTRRRAREGGQFTFALSRRLEARPQIVTSPTSTTSRRDRHRAKQHLGGPARPRRPDLYMRITRALRATAERDSVRVSLSRRKSARGVLLRRKRSCPTRHARRATVIVTPAGMLARSGPWGTVSAEDSTESPRAPQTVG